MQPIKHMNLDASTCLSVIVSSSIGINHLYCSTDSSQSINDLISSIPTPTYPHLFHPWTHLVHITKEEDKVKKEIFRIILSSWG